MVVVRSVEDFARKNEGDLRRLMNFKTGIFDKGLVDEAVQEFYVKLIETRALESFNEEEGAFKTYITNLFFWSLPGMRRKNFRVNFDVLSSVTIDIGSSLQKNVDVWDFVGGKSCHTVDFEPKRSVSKDKGSKDEVPNVNTDPHVRLRVDCRFNCPSLDSAEEESFYSDIEDFKNYIRRTESSIKAKRMVTYIEKKLEGCKGSDIAEILKVSSTMIRLIKNETKEKYAKWKKFNA
jgi:DNA-directed RNA polymerase specialized sigma24 family protein